MQNKAASVRDESFRHSENIYKPTTHHSHHNKSSNELYTVHWGMMTEKKKRFATKSSYTLDPP